MTRTPTRVSDIGELRLLKDVLLPSVHQQPYSLGDDCARVELNTGRVLWSVDPCPTPVAQLLGVCSPDVLGWYTALINLSDIAACGGTPKGLLVSLEMPDDTTIEFVTSFQRGLMTLLSLYDTPLLGGNVKAAPRFSATGTIIGEEGTRHVSRRIDLDDCDAFLIGHCGAFWASVIGHCKGWGSSSDASKNAMINALKNPLPQISAGRILSELPYQVACMDCSDGPANALFQLASINSLDLVVPDQPSWSIHAYSEALLTHHGTSIENACYHFGDWQLACLVPHTEIDTFQEALKELPLTWLGRTRAGFGRVTTNTGRLLRRDSLNENFRYGYNSIKSVDDLIERYLQHAIFD